ncbi:hypothetical protein [Klebsiella pneumoniae]|uniref:hypothetical protein n=1 Tax=Klebsiella pneumoniae TaxID=573 RepID=UPI00296F7792|nr:hypothetical protein [Klebsiella pneumoniae]
MMSLSGKSHRDTQASEALSSAPYARFLNNTVQPFSDVVSVEAFGAVIGHPAEEWEQLLAVYARACEATEAHDTRASANYRFPRVRSCSAISPSPELIKNATKRRTAYENLRRERTAQRKKLFGG